jgi:hypothetical protein
MKARAMLRAAASAALLLALCTGASAVQMRMDAGSVPFAAELPDGWCAFSDDKADQAFAKYLSRAAGRSIRIIGAAAPCRELAVFRKSGKRIPKRFAAVAQVGIDGGFGRFLLGRTIYTKLITSFKPGDMARTEKHATRRLSEYGDSVGGLKVKILGTASKSAWFAGQGAITHKSGGSETLRLVGGSTLVSKYPIAAFYVTTGSDSLEAALKAVAAPLLKAVDTAR